MIDSHTHLDSCEPAERRAGRRGAARRACGGSSRSGMDAESCRSATMAAERFPEVYAAVGRHPNLADGLRRRATWPSCAALAAHERCRAIGETGPRLLPRPRAAQADQERAFEAQIELARELGKPLVIHTRAAEDDTIATLARAAPTGVRVILHCFSMPDRLDECLEQRLVDLVRRQRHLPEAPTTSRAAAERVPDERLLVETDAPYLTPQAVRKERNQPAFVVHTARFVAERRGVDLRGARGRRRAQRRRAASGGERDRRTLPHPAEPAPDARARRAPAAATSARTSSSTPTSSG